MKVIKSVLGWLIILLLIAGFFISYHYFLIDISLEEVQYALGQMNTSAAGIELQSVDLLVQDVYLTRVIKGDFSSEELISLEGTHDIFKNPKALQEQKEGISFFLSVLEEEKEKRGDPLTKRINLIGTYANKFIHYLSSDVLRRWYRRPVPAALREITSDGSKLFEQAHDLEMLWQFEFSENSYHNFLNEFSEFEYKTAGTAKARYGFLEAKLGDFKDARDSLHDIVHDFNGRSEAAFAQILLDKTARLEKIRAKRDFLVRQLDKQKSGAVQDTKAHTSLADRIQKQAMFTFQSSAQAYFELGVLNLSLYDLDDAYRAFEKASQETGSDEDKTQIKFLMAWTLKMKKQYEESRRLFEMLAGGGAKGNLATQSDIMIALIARAQGKFEEAAERLEAIASKVNEGGRSLASLLEVQAAYVYFYDLNDIVRARQALERAKKYAPAGSLVAGFLDRQLEPFLDRNLRDAAFEQMRLENYQEAKKLFNDALKIDSKDAWIYSGLGLTKKLLGEDVLQAMEITQKGHELKADEYTAAAVGYLFEMKNEKDLAAEFYKKAIQINPNYLVAVYNLGRLYLMMGQYENASTRFLWIKERGKSLPEIYSRAMNNLGCCWWRMGLKDQAAGALHEAVQADPKIAEVHYNLSISYELTGEAKLASEEKSKAIALEPKLATLDTSSGLVSV